MNIEQRVPNESRKPKCCRIGCDHDAVYELRDTNGSPYEDYTHSCPDCIDQLFFDGCNSIEKRPWFVTVEAMKITHPSETPEHIRALNYEAMLANTELIS